MAARLVGRFKSMGAFGTGHLGEGVFAPVDFLLDEADHRPVPPQPVTCESSFR